MALNFNYNCFRSTTLQPCCYSSESLLFSYFIFFSLKRPPPSLLGSRFHMTTCVEGVYILGAHAVTGHAPYSIASPPSAFPGRPFPFLLPTLLHSFRSLLSGPFSRAQPRLPPQFPYSSSSLPSLRLASRERDIAGRPGPLRLPELTTDNKSYRAQYRVDKAASATIHCVRQFFLFVSS